MKKGAAFGIRFFIGILLTLAVVIPGRGLVDGCSALNGEYGLNKVQVSVRNQADPAGRNTFSIDDIKNLKKELPENDISFFARSALISTPVSGISPSGGGTPLAAKLSGVDCRYQYFNGLTLEAGSFFTQKQEEEGTMLAVVDTELAWELFRTREAVGRTLNINGNMLRIVGVVKKDASIIGKLTDDGLPDVYIPAKVMLALDETARITALQIKTAEKVTLNRNVSDISSALRKIGKKPSDYNIVDYSLNYALMEQKPLIFTFILGMTAIIVLLLYIKRAIADIYHMIKDGCRADYLSNVIRRHTAFIANRLLGIIPAAAGILLMWPAVRFRLYIPPQYIPDELINIAYYSALIKGLIQGNIQSAGYIAPYAELTVNTAGMLLNLLFFVSAAFGLPVLVGALHESAKTGIGLPALTFEAGLLFALSLGVLAWAAHSAGLPFKPDIKSMAAAWTFIFLLMLHYCEVKERGMENVKGNY